MKPVISRQLFALSLSAACLIACGKDASNRRSYSQHQDKEGDLTKDEPQTPNGPAGETTSGEGNTDKPLYALVASVGLRNFDQINLSFAKLTGISPATTAIRNQFLAVKSDLPSSSDLKTMTPAKVSAITKLAAQYCDTLVADTAKRGAIFGSFNFSATPSVAFQNPTALAKSMIEAFWGKDLASLANQETDVKELADLIRAMAQGKANTATTTSAVVMGACTATLAAAPVIVM